MEKGIKKSKFYKSPFLVMSVGKILLSYSLIFKFRFIFTHCHDKKKILLNFALLYASIRK